MTDPNISPRQMLDARAAAQRTLAAVDLGSNSFHLLIARETTPGRLEIVEHIKEVVRLGADLDGGGAICAPAMARGLACVARFAEQLRRAAPASVRAVGTNALRVAANAQTFLERAAETLGCPVETVSGIEEARLIWLGVSHHLAPGPRRLVIDVGGGSTELINGEAGKPLRLDSLPVGCVTLTQRYFGDGKLEHERFRQAQIAARCELEPVAGLFRELGWAEVAGASGTVHAIADIARHAGWSDGSITPVTLDWLEAALAEAGELAQLRLAGIDAEQLPVLPGGLAILRAIFAGLGIRQMRAVPGALREGIAYDLLARMDRSDTRDRSSRALAERCGADTDYAARVEHTAAELLRQAADAWELCEPACARWLAWAARLHEIGRVVACNGYHRHGAYLIEHADLAGFSRQDQQAVAALVRTHRRELTGDEFDAFPAPFSQRLERLAVLLRVAVLLHRPRGAAAEAIEVTPGARRLELRFPPGWLAVHPLAAADLEAEATALAAIGWALACR